MTYQRALELMRAVGASRPDIASRIYDAVEQNDPLAAEAYTEYATAVLAPRYAAQRRAEVERAARIALLEPPPYDEDQNIREAAEAFTRAILGGSRRRQPSE